MIAAGVRFGCVLADAGLRPERAVPARADGAGLAWAVGIPRISRCIRSTCNLIWPVAKRGRPRQRSIPGYSVDPGRRHAGRCQVAERSLGVPARKARSKRAFAAVRVRIADGPPQRIRDKGQQHLPGDEAWLIGEHRALRREEILPRQPARRTDPAHLCCHHQARWIREQAHQQLKEELGLDHFEGPILARPSSPCAHDDDRLRLPATSSPHPSETGKKELTDRRLSQACRPSVTPSSPLIADRRLSDAHTAEKGSRHRIAA